MLDQPRLVTDSFNLAEHAGRVAQEMARICENAQYEDLAAAFRLAAAIAATHEAGARQPSEPE